VAASRSGRAPMCLMASDSWSRTFASGLANAARRFSCTAHTGDVQLIRAGSSATNNTTSTRSPCSRRKAEFKLPGAYRKPSDLHCIRYNAQTRQSRFGLWTEDGGRPWRGYRHRNGLPSYGLTSSPTRERVCMSACGGSTTTGYKATPLLRHHG
jgi:hypothetical protein